MRLAKRIRLGIGRRISMLGEKLGNDRLIYNRFHFEHFRDHALANAPGVIGSLIEEFPGARRWVDVGAGSGDFAAELQRRGLTSVACEHNAYGRKIALANRVNAVPFDLTKNPP